MLKNALNRFRFISFVEGISYLILVFIAMPIKYLGENPYPVKVVGMAHGVLFILFVVLLIESMRKYDWGNNFSTKLFIYSLIPFGSLVIEKKIKNINA